LLQAVSCANSLDDLKVEDTMTTPVYVLEHEPIGLVLNLMVQRQVLSMPVVANRNLVGVISRTQVLRPCLPKTLSSVVPTCPSCERVDDLAGGSVGKGAWKDLALVSAMHHLKSSDSGAGHTNCPSCHQTFQSLRTTSECLSPEASDGKPTRPCLLLVDDDSSVAAVLSDVLQEWGYDVLIARNGREGLDIVGRRSIDGILLDMHMPVMDGRTMLDELRWLGHQMPVLMMSGGSDERVLRQLLQEGAQGFFMKPFHLSSLQQACQQIFKTNAVEEQTSRQTQVA
jgi:two-component system response regulator (stage 0 sporulation protein F)